MPTPTPSPSPTHTPSPSPTPSPTPSHTPSPSPTPTPSPTPSQSPTPSPTPTPTPTPTPSSTPTINPTSTKQSILIPAYWDPPVQSFDTVDQSTPAVGIIIVSTDSIGPGTSVEPALAKQILATQATGCAVVGYVNTGEGQIAIATVEGQVDTWYQLYPTLDGIFFDVVSDQSKEIPFYVSIGAYVRTKPGKHIVIFNPGSDVPQGYQPACDILCVYEDTYANYVNWEPQPENAWIFTAPPQGICHIVYTCPETDLQATLALSKSRGAGHIYMTTQSDPNPYESLPVASYWATEVAFVNNQ
jgi:hypothetical protein